MKQYLLLAAFLTAVSVEAQQLKGRVADAQGEPVAFANVVLLRADSTFVSGNVSDETGNFSLGKRRQRWAKWWCAGRYPSRG